MNSWEGKTLILKGDPESSDAKEGSIASAGESGMVDMLQDGWEGISRIFNSISLFLIRIDSNGEVTLWTRTAEKTFGISKDNALGKALGECGVSWDMSRVDEGISLCIEEERPVRVEDLRFKKPDGKQRFLSLTIIPVVAEDGSTACFALLGYDVTQRKILEVQLVQAQKLKGIGRITSGVASEIYSPMQYLGDNLRFLREAFKGIETLVGSYRDALDSARRGVIDKKALYALDEAVEQADWAYLEEEIPRAIDQTLEGVDIVAKTVQAMNVFSQPGMEEKTETDLNTAIESLVTITRPDWKFAAKVTTDLDPELGVVPCYPGELNQALLNLLVNAAQAVAEKTDNGAFGKGVIRVSTRLDGDWAEIRISDSGTGIPEEIRDKIYDPFFSTRSVKGGHSGQGLAVALFFIKEMHEGTIDFETKQGRGTTFIVKLPLEQDKRMNRVLKP